MGRTNDRYGGMPPPPARMPHCYDEHGNQVRKKRPNKALRRRSKARSPVKHSSSSSTASSSVASSVPTSAMTFRSSRHGRMRRGQRLLSKRQLKAALKHGRRSAGSAPGTSKYIHNGITFIVDDRTKREITSYATPLDLPFKQVSPEDLQRHDWAKKQIDTRAATYCKSHSVLLVDTSGSMRNSDVQGSRTRLAAVWYSIAEDFVRNRLESGIASQADAISIVLMGETAKLHPILHNVPTDWVTYNAVLQIYKEGSITPAGHGCYRPALTKAEEILTQYNSSSCALVLAVMSDGRPSDASVYRQSWEDGTKSITSSVASLSSKLGRRLTVSAIGMGSANQFDTLKQMTDEAANHESLGVFQVPSLSSSSIGAAISSIATSLTETQLSEADGGKQKFVRTVTRENRSQMAVLTEVVTPEDYQVFMGNSVQHLVFDPEGREESFKVVPFQHPDARGVAIARKAFGEGTERFAYQFFEVAEDGQTVVGDALVAKESKFVTDATGKDDLKKYVRRFCRIHHQVTKVADAFNAKLDTIKALDPDTSRVAFLPCSMYFIDDPATGTRLAVSVEKRLFGKFQKWNSNNGWLRTRRSSVMPALAPVKEESGLATIKEEPEPDAVGSNVDMGSSTAAAVGNCMETAIEIDDAMEVDDCIFVSHNDVAQAFSHFSYIYGGRKSLICDLQGINDRQNRLLQFTDPVIHFFDVTKENKQGQYGRTDRGEKGIEDFLNSHTCNALCNLATKGFMPVTDAGKKMQE